MEKKITSPVVKGLIISLALIVFAIVTYLTNQLENKALGYLQYVILAAGIIWACISYANENDNYVTYGNVFGHGFKTTALIAAVMAIYVLLAFKVLFPELMDKSLEIARTEMEKNKGLSDDDIDKGMEISRRYMTPIVIGSTLFGLMFFGTIFSLIGAAVAKKKPITPFDKPTEEGL